MAPKNYDTKGKYSSGAATYKNTHQKSGSTENGVEHTNWKMKFFENN